MYFTYTKDKGEGRYEHLSGINVNDKLCRIDAYCSKPYIKQKPLGRSGKTEVNPKC